MSDLPASSEIAAIPGDPSGIRLAANRYTNTADALRDAAAEITRLAGQSDLGFSDAIDALVETAGDVAGRLAKLKGRYETAGSELSTYASSLADAQSMAAGAVDLRDNAQAESATAQYWADHYENEARSAADPAEQAEALRMLRIHDNTKAAANSDLTVARQTYQNAIELRDDAATLASNRISTAIEKDGLNDTAWDNFSGWVAEHAELLTWIKNVLGALAAALAVLSMFFPLLAPLALLVAGLTALLSLVLAMTGEISWIEFGLDFLSFATLGVAAVAGTALKGTMQALKSSRVVNVASQGTTKSPIRVVTGSFNGVQPNKITQLDKVKWAIETFNNKGLANAQAMRILNNAKAGAGGLVDDALVRLGKTQVAAQILARRANTAFSLPNAVLKGVDGPVGDFVGNILPDTADPALNLLGGASDWFKGINADATFRVGSNW